MESGIKRQYLSSKFETTNELLGISNVSADPASVSILPWIPKTTAAVAVRLLELDASIMYIKPEKAEPSEDNEVKEYVVRYFLFYFPLLTHCMPADCGFVKWCMPILNAEQLDKYIAIVCFLQILLVVSVKLLTGHMFHVLNLL